MYPTKISHKDSEMYQNKIEKIIIKKSYWALNIYIKEQLLVMFRVKKCPFHLMIEKNCDKIFTTKEKIVYTKKKCL